MRSLILGSMLSLALCGTSVWAQAPAPAAPANGLGSPTITVILSSTDELNSDLKFVIDTLGKQPQQFTTLKDTLEVFTAGTDTTKPVGLRSYLVNGKLTHILSVPINTPKELKDFLANLSSLDIKNKPVAGNANLFQMLKLFQGYLHYVPNIKVAQIGENQAEVLKLVTPIPAQLLNGRDMISILENNAAGVAQRQQAFKKVKEELLAAVKKGEKEEQADFEIRQAAIEHQIAELERFFIESSKVSVGWVLSAEKKQAVLDLGMTALPKTSLAESIDLLGKTPDQFATVVKEDTILSGSINFPIDALRKQHLLTGIKLWRPRLKQLVDAATDKTDEQKETRRELVDLIINTVEEVANDGVFNGFVRVYPNAPRISYTTVGATRVTNGNKFEAAIINLQARLKDRVKLNIELVEEVKIHSIAVPDMFKERPEFFANDAVLYVGTTGNAVWYAAGEDGLTRLKAAIVQAKQAAPAQAPPAIDFTMKVGPWVELADKHPGPLELKLPPKEQKQIQDMRKLAITALTEGNDTLSLTLDRKDDEVKLHLQFDEGLLRTAGKVIGKVVKDNLE